MPRRYSQLKSLYDELHVNVIFEQESRKYKAKKILAALNSFVEYPAKSRLLDVGAESGYIANELAASFEFVASIDVTDMRRPTTSHGRDLSSLAPRRPVLPRDAK